MRIKKISLSFVLFVFFLLSIIYAIYAINHKIKNYGFTVNPNTEMDVWLVEAKITYETTGEPIKISLTTPNSSMILGDTINAVGYKVQKNVLKDKKIIEFTKNSKINKEENIYYKVLLLENSKFRYNPINNKKIPEIEKPYLNDSQNESVKKLIELAKKENSDFITNLVLLLNQKPAIPEVQTFLPLKIDQKQIFDIIKSLLSLENIPVRMIRGVSLVEGKTFQKPDLMLEAYVNNKWNIYDLETGEIGLPNNFLVFQYGGDSLLDVEGGKNSKVLFSVLKNKYNSLFLSKYKAELNSNQNRYNYSMYNLPIREQNMFKFITVFPLAILVIVFLRNIVGLKTLGTFTPMLIGLSFIQTGLINGLITFTFLITIGLIFRSLFTKMNLLLVPRISAVVILVIFITQIITIISYNLNIQIGLYLLFFPLIITAWIIERMSIMIEENGFKDAINQIFITLLVSIITYIVISSEQTRYIMYVFNELNICILFLVMLIGTYTGYRFTELLRFKPLIRK